MNRRKFIYTTTACGLLVPSRALSQAAAAIIHADAGSGAPPACTTARDAQTSASQGSDPLGNDTSNQYCAQKIVPVATYTACAVDLYLEAIGSPTGTITVAIFSHDSGNDQPSSQIGTASDTVDASTIGGAEEVVSFSNLSADVTASSTYWIVAWRSTTDVSNYIAWHRRNGGASGESMMDDDNGAGTWAAISSNRRFKHQVYST
jgi:hypothetical protein